MKTSNGVTKETLEKLQKKLLERKAKIEKELATIASKDEKLKGDYDTRFPDFGTPQSTDESSLEVTAYESALPLEYALELRLADTNKALEKIKNGQYGQCEKCGESIDSKRLEVIPEAKYCIKHQK